MLFLNQSKIYPKKELRKYDNFFSICFTFTIINLFLNDGKYIKGQKIYEKQQYSLINLKIQ